MIRIDECRLCVGLARRGALSAGLQVSFVLAVAGCGRLVPSTPSTASSLHADSTVAGQLDWCLASLHPSQESKHGVAGGFAALNGEFLAAHARARLVLCRQLERERLIMRYSFGTLEARWRGRSLSAARISVLPPEYHPIKDVSHAVFLTALLFDEPHGTARNKHVEDVIAALKSARADLQSPTSAIGTLLPVDQRLRQEQILVAVGDVLELFAAEKLDDRQKQAFFDGIRAELLENLRVVSSAVLRTLDENVRRFRAVVEKEDPRAWNTLLVVIGVMHQARAREIGVQYFERLLAEPVGEGARNERRMVITEGLIHGSEQYGLMAAHLVDVAGAQKIFGDPQRLQWDVLAGDGEELKKLIPGSDH
jgi:hypothetical protein